METVTPDDGDKCYDMFEEAYRQAGKALGIPENKVVVLADWRTKQGVRPNPRNSIRKRQNTPCRK